MYSRNSFLLIPDKQTVDGFKPIETFSCDFYIRGVSWGLVLPPIEPQGTDHTDNE